MGYKRKKLQDMTITDNFMFGAVMLDPESCRQMLEMILERPIERVEVVAEKSMIYHPEYHGIRLDVFVRDEKGSRFDVEMQVEKTSVMKRSRYYHSQMDMDMLTSGTDYENLPDSYVIFICDYDPFDKGKYRYRFNSQCKDCPGIGTEDGIHTIILSNRGKNSEEVPQELVSFLQYTKKPLAESMEDTGDPFIRMIQDRIRWVKASREMGERYMKLELLIKEERKEAERDLVINLVIKGRLTQQEGAEELNLSFDEFKDLMDEYSKRGERHSNQDD